MCIYSRIAAVLQTKESCLLLACKHNVADVAVLLLKSGADRSGAVNYGSTFSNRH
jgi:hypothetical protein